MTRHNREAKEIESVPRRDFLKGKISKLSIPFSCVAFHGWWCVPEWWRPTSPPTQSLQFRGYRRVSRDTRKIAPAPPSGNSTISKFDRETNVSNSFAFESYAKIRAINIDIVTRDREARARNAASIAISRASSTPPSLRDEKSANTYNRCARPGGCACTTPPLTALCAPFPFPNILPPQRPPYPATRTGLYTPSRSCCVYLSLLSDLRTRPVSIY